MSQPNSNFLKKVESFRQLITSAEQPHFWPTDLSDFALWKDEEKGFTSFSRPVLYSDSNAMLLTEVRSLICVAKERWAPSKNNLQNQIRMLEKLNKILASRYHQERQMRLDAEQLASAHLSAIDSLRSEIQRLSKPKLVGVNRQ